MKRSLLVLVVVMVAASVSGAAPKFPFPPRGGPNGPNNPANMQMTDYEFNVLNSASVRLLNPPVEFDDKGKPIKLTGEELKKRKGDTSAEQKMPGIKSDFGALKPGDLVQVSFSKPSKPKDLENSTWTKLSGGMSGMVTSVDNGKMTIRVSPLLNNGLKGPGAGIPGRGGDTGGDSKQMINMILRREAPKNVIKPEQRQASMIVIVEQAPDMEAARPGKGRGKKNQ